jgi:hypothetical protein
MDPFLLGTMPANEKTCCRFNIRKWISHPRPIAWSMVCSIYRIDVISIHPCHKFLELLTRLEDAPVSSWSRCLLYGGRSSGFEQSSQWYKRRADSVYSSAPWRHSSRKFSRDPSGFSPSSRSSKAENKIGLISSLDVDSDSKRPKAPVRRRETRATADCASCSLGLLDREFGFPARSISAEVRAA